MTDLDQLAQSAAQFAQPQAAQVQPFVDPGPQGGPLNFLAEARMDAAARLATALRQQMSTRRSDNVEDRRGAKPNP